MSSFNKVILIGNMTADPELRQTNNGLSVCSFSIAVNRRNTKSDNEQSVDFINVVAWRQTAEFVSRYFRKGKPILICGQLQTRSWTDNQGNKRTSTEVLADEVSFVGGENTAQSNDKPVGQYPNPAAWGKPQQAQNSMPQTMPVVDDGDLPF
jgi:single-strand DNA-binding protein